MFAIRHTFPNGQQIGDGLIHSGDSTPTPVAKFDFVDAQLAVTSMRYWSSEGHRFDIVMHPDTFDRPLGGRDENAASHMELAWVADQLNAHGLNYPLSGDLTTKTYPGAEKGRTFAGNLWRQSFVQATAL